MGQPSAALSLSSDGENEGMNIEKITSTRTICYASCSRNIPYPSTDMIPPIPLSPSPPHSPFFPPGKSLYVGSSIMVPGSAPSVKSPASHVSNHSNPAFLNTP